MERIERGYVDIEVHAYDSEDGESIQAELLRLAKTTAEAERLRLAADWGEDYGDVLWWTVPISDPPYVGSPLDSNWVDGIYTHWTPIIVPKEDQP